MNMVSGNKNGSVLDVGRRILVVDDEESILMVTTELLNVLGHEARPASSLEQAQNAIIDAQENETPFDIAIIDLVLSGTDTGNVVNHTLKSLSPRLITIASSGQTSSPVLEEPTAYGFTAGLKKPYSLKDINAVISSLQNNVLLHS